MKRIVITLLIAGVVTFGAAFVYDVLFAGIPYQDPTPQLSARYQYHSAVAGSLYNVGLWLLLIGTVSVCAWLVTAAISRVRSRRTNRSQPEL
jgi:hypothetical protein